MDKILPVFTLLFIFNCSTLLSYGQHHSEQCGTNTVLENKLKKDPTLKKRMQHAEWTAANWLEHHKSSRSNHSITIPVVVHVVYNSSDPAQNIHDTVIQSQIDVLNEDFRRWNADTANTRAIFDTIAADTEISFCLASLDPLNSPTNGITRTATTETFDMFSGTHENVKSTADGGHDPWPTNQYLNLWSCELLIFGSPGAVLGYAQFPGGDPATDGVVINYSNFGRTYDPNAAPANLGRTGTHEVGHWFGLRHIWGDEGSIFGPGNCDSTDYVYDTPMANSASESNCDFSRNTCSNEKPYWDTLGIDPPDMVENYMDYSADACMNSFTNGQSNRMWSFIDTDAARNALYNSMGCAATVYTDTICSTSCDGEASVFPSYGIAPYTYEWDDLGSQDSAVATGLCPGTYSVKIIDSANDTLIVSNIIVPVATTLSGSIALVSDASCSSCGDGEATINVIGGTTPYNYSWSDNAAQTTATATALLPGEYTVTITDDCGIQFIDTVAIDFPEGLENKIRNSEIEIFPNPSSGTLNIVQHHVLNENHQVLIINAIGEIVKQFSLSGDKLQIDLGHLPDGFYFVKISNAEEIIVKKLVLSKGY